LSKPAIALAGVVLLGALTAALWSAGRAEDGCSARPAGGPSSELANPLASALASVLANVPANVPASVPANADGDFPEPDTGPLQWPRAHGPHADQRAEYWLLAGRLKDDAGRRYGVQLAFFRVALQPGEPERDSRWASHTVYRAHLVLGAAGEPPYAAARYSRAALELAGADSGPPRVWLENWKATFVDAAGAIDLRARDGRHGVELRLRLPEAAPIPFDGPAYRGYWLPGIEARGTLIRGGEPIEVTGDALLDRAWGRALPLGRGQMTLARLWWVSGDGAHVRCRQLRRRAAGGTPLTRCLRRRAGGAVEALGPERLELEPLPGAEPASSATPYRRGWQLTLEEADRTWVLHPLSRADARFELPLWSAVVEDASDGDAWGLLELSNDVRRR